MDAVYEKMYSLGLNDIVGGGDAPAIGDQNLTALQHLALLEPDMALLDFGCGCGRLALPALAFLSNNGCYVGVDIVPKLVDFCQEEIASHYNNARFYRSLDSNKLYDKFVEKDQGKADSIHDLAELGEERFDVIAAFSVFTHLSYSDSIVKLRELKALLKPGGNLLISCFIANHSSRAQVASGVSGIQFGKEFQQEQDEYRIEYHGELAAVAFTHESLMAAAEAAGLEPVVTYYGNWCGRDRRHSYQDIAVFTQTLRLPESFDPVEYLRLNPDLPWSPDKEGLRKAIEHYLLSGQRERRVWKQQS